MADKSLTVWDYKPWWCQPWSIVLTGCGIVAAIAYFVPWIWAKIVFSLPFLVWMIFFTVVYPKQMQAYLQERSELN